MISRGHTIWRSTLFSLFTLLGITEGYDQFVNQQSDTQSIYLSFTLHIRSSSSLASQSLNYPLLFDFTSIRGV
jgi:hypothetical protein